MTRIKIRPILGKLLTGESVIRDFATVGVQDDIQERVILDGLDVSRTQWLLGLDPRILGVWTAGDWRPSPKHRMDFQLDGKTAASLDLDPAGEIEDSKGTLHLMKVTGSAVHHISGITAKILYNRFYKKPGVDFERLKAVAAAYSYPRRVRVISFQDGPDYNYIFPMDLLGDIRNDKRYLLGMRHSNQVLKKIMHEGKIVVSEVPAGLKKLIYSLGRQHSASPPPVSELPFGTIRTAEFNYHIPAWAESYKEIRILQTRDIGSHMLLFGEWADNHVLQSDTPHLHHIHFLHYLYAKKHGSLHYPVIE